MAPPLPLAPDNNAAAVTERPCDTHTAEYGSLRAGQPKMRGGRAVQTLLIIARAFQCQGLPPLPFNATYTIADEILDPAHFLNRLIGDTSRAQPFL